MTASHRNSAGSETVTPIEYPSHKTKIVCTIGPATDSEESLEALIRAGMNVARLNFSHGTFAEHADVIGRIRAAVATTGRRVAIMADLPGPKLRIGTLAEEDIELEAGQSLLLTTEDVIGDRSRIGVDFPRLTAAVAPGDRVFINDGVIELRVDGVDGADIQCTVLVGGELRSRKGLNLPGIDLGISAFTDRDRECLAFALEHGVDAVSQSFVANAGDIEAVRDAARDIGHSPFVIAKIERAQAMDNIDEILAAADGIMVARGDLGVEIPIEHIAIAQKRLMAAANIAAKPVITATHMLDSMVEQRRPTRAEATDVANAILDGTDCVMLSAESAVGRFPVEATAMLAKIAAAVEPYFRGDYLSDQMEVYGSREAVSTVDLIALSVHHTIERVVPEAVIVPTRSGSTARNVTRFRLPTWITAMSASEATCQALQFSYGVHAVAVEPDVEDWSVPAREWLAANGIESGVALLTQGPSPENPRRSHRMEIIELGEPSDLDL